MSEPASPAASDIENKKGEVQYRFCQECSNLLYPKEDRATSELLYICKACHAVTKADSACTYRMNLSSQVAETAGVTTDVANDPTVGDDSKELPCFCTMCGDQLLCVECGQPSSGTSDISDLSDESRSP